MTSQVDVSLPLAAVLCLISCSAAREPADTGQRVKLDAAQQSTLGFSYADVMAQFDAEFTGTLNWRGENSRFVFDPNSGSSTLEYGFVIETSCVVEVTPCQWKAETGSDSNVAPDCRAYLELDAQVRLSTADRKLNDEFAGRIRIFGETDWEFDGESSSLQGGFRVLDGPLGVNAFTLFMKSQQSSVTDGSFGVVVRSGGGQSFGTSTGAIAAVWTASSRMASAHD